MVIHSFGIRDSQASAYLRGKAVGNLGVPRHGLNPACVGTCPQRMRPSLPLEIASMPTKMPQKFVAFHPMATRSRMAVAGTPRSASSRRSSRINSMAFDRLLMHSALVLPCPFAPGISGQYATNHFPSRSTTAVNSLCISSPHFLDHPTTRAPQRPTTKQANHAKGKRSSQLRNARKPRKKI
jgi:hypothetical protein